MLLSETLELSSSGDLFSSFCSIAVDFEAIPLVSSFSNGLTEAESYSSVFFASSFYGGMYKQSESLLSLTLSSSILAVFFFLFESLCNIEA